MRTQTRVAPYVAGVWREIEAVLIVVTPIGLLGGTLIAAIDRLSDGQLSIAAPWLLMCFAVAKAVGVTFWPAIAVEEAREALRERHNITGWVILILALGVVDVQVLLQYGFIHAHMTGWGFMSWLDVTPLEWLGEQSILGFVLALIGKAIIDAPRVTVAPAPVIELPAPPPVTRPAILTLTPETKARKRRIDAGTPSMNRTDRVNLVARWQHEEPQLSISDITERLGCHKQSAISYRREARQMLKQQV